MLLELQSPIFPLIVIEFKLVQFLKAVFPIEVTLLGITSVFTPVQPSNAPLFSVVTLLGRVIDVRDVLSAKA